MNDDPKVEPHEFSRQGWRWWLCRHCFAPKVLHPRSKWVKARPIGNHVYYSINSPHFTDEGW